MFPRECFLHNDPRFVYDCVGWQREDGKYRLKGPNGIVLANHDEFTPISASHEELLQYTADGKMVTVKEQCETGAGFSFVTAGRVHSLGGQPSHAQGHAASGPHRPPSGSGRASGAARSGQSASRPAAAVVDAVKKTIAEMLGSCNGDRNEMAKIASEVTGDHGPDLVLKYAHLDNGRFRMTLGNKMRSIMLVDDSWAHLRQVG